MKSISDDISSAHPKKVVYNDDEYGNFLPGMRVQWEKWLPFVEGDDADWVRQMRRRRAADSVEQQAESVLETVG